MTTGFGPSWREVAAGGSVGPVVVASEASFPTGGGGAVGLAVGAAATALVDGGGTMRCAICGGTARIEIDVVPVWFVSGGWRRPFAFRSVGVARPYLLHRPVSLMDPYPG